MSPSSSWNEVGKWLPNVLLLLNPKEHRRHQHWMSSQRSRDLQAYAQCESGIKQEPAVG